MLSIRSLLTIAFIAFGTALMAQSGTLLGNVQDGDEKAPLPFANVVVKKNGILIKGSQTDFDGNYRISPLDPGTYTVEFSYVGKATKRINGIVIGADQQKKLNMTLQIALDEMEVIEIVAKKKVIIGEDTKQVRTAEELDQQASQDAADGATATMSTAAKKDDGEAPSAAGSRSSSNDTYINGVKIIGLGQLPAPAVEQVTVIQGGVPARYGDATGMIINITTKGISSKLHGGINVLSSELTDPYGYNMVEGSLLGPLAHKKEVQLNKAGDAKLKSKVTGGDSIIKKPNFGFMISGRFLHQMDQDPSAIGVWRLTDSIYDALVANPVIASPSGQGNQMTANYYTKENFEHVKVKDNNKSMDITIMPNFEYFPSENLKIGFGGRYSFRRRNSWTRTYSLMNYNNMSVWDFNTYSGYGKITQWLTSEDGSKEDDNAKELKKPFITGAYYTLQFDYTNDGRKFYHPTHQFNPFNYGYIGQFDSEWAADEDDFVFDPEYGGLVLQGYGDKDTKFTPGEVNPILANYTSSFYTLNGENPDGLDIIRTGGGLVNGDNPQNVMGIWNNVGAMNSTYFYTNQDQYRLTLIANVNLNFKVGSEERDGKVINKYATHAIEFGGEYEQRDFSTYQITGAAGLWGRMRQLTNSHISLDEDNPITGTFNINGFNVPNVTYFNEIADLDAQSNFDRNLRTSLGLNADGNTHIDVFNLTPDQVNLEMFTPDELISQGSNSLVSYNGYDYLGNRLTTQPSFADYWKAKDADGNFTRPIGSYAPIYSAFFIQDKFFIDNLNFNIGLRVDRFDANQKVLRDQYSIYGLSSVADVKAGNELLEDVIPGNIQDDYAVYVTDINATADGLNANDIVGYRNGDTWYTADGVVTDNPDVIAESSNTGSITPLLVTPGEDIKTEDYNVDNAFKDYEPYMRISPRILFNFKLKAKSMFFAHYDVLTQRPSTGNIGSPFEYMFRRELNNIQTFSNPDLKPEQTIDYSVGFKQAFSDFAAITIKGYYREMRNMINMTRINYAYPISYTTFGNIDFSTVKGLTTTFEQLRRKNFRFLVDYTLQFADGTGSSATSAAGILASDQPNLRTIFPLSFDQRHTIATNMDYRFGKGSNYDGPRKKVITVHPDYTDTTYENRRIFENLGLNVTLRMASGTPYSRQSQPTSEAELTPSRSSLLGSMNGSRLPWTSKVDIKLDKKFVMFAAKDKDGKKIQGTGLQCQVFVQMLNALDARNIVAVYSFTGNAQDDGFLSSSLGQEKVASFEEQGTSQAYVDYYMMKVLNPHYFTMPRRTRIGLVVNF